MSLLEQLDSALLAAMDDLGADFATYIGCDKVLAIQIQRRACIEAMAQEADQEARAGNEWHARRAG